MKNIFTQKINSVDKENTNKHIIFSLTFYYLFRNVYPNYFELIIHPISRQLNDHYSCQNKFPIMIPCLSLFVHTSNKPCRERMLGRGRCCRLRKKNIQELINLSKANAPNSSTHQSHSPYVSVYSRQQAQSNPRNWCQFRACLPVHNTRPGRRALTLYSDTLGMPNFGG